MTCVEAARGIGTPEGTLAEVIAVVAHRGREARRRHIFAEGDNCFGRIGTKPRLAKGCAASAAGQTTKDC